MENAAFFEDPFSFAGGWTLRNSERVKLGHLQVDYCQN
jgi:hypothetical protein